MAGTDNLIPLNKRTKDEQREFAKKGGEASGRARRKKANLKRALEAALTTEIPAGIPATEGTRMMLEAMGLDLTYEQALAVSVVTKAIAKGDAYALSQIVAAVHQHKTPEEVTAMRERTKATKARAALLEDELAARKDTSHIDKVDDLMNALDAAMADDDDEGDGAADE